MMENEMELTAAEIAPTLLRDNPLLVVPGPINEIATALAKAQGEMSNAALNKTNPHFKSKYADLASIRDATVPALSKNGLSIIQIMTLDDGAMTLVTRLLHTSGQFFESVYPLPVVLDKPQVMGSAQTYAKRYSWAAICGISADEDDDANAATSPGENNKPGASVRRAVADPVPGITALKKECQAIVTDIHSCGDLDSLIVLQDSAGFRNSVNAMKDKWPDGYDAIIDAGRQHKEKLAAELQTALDAG